MHDFFRYPDQRQRHGQTDKQRERERERILFATALQAYQKGYKPI